MNPSESQHPRAMLRSERRRHPSELQHQRAVFERASIGVVEADLDGLVQYANGHAMELLGVTSYQGTRLAMFFDDQEVLQEQLASRRAGLIGSYRTTMVRASDGTRIPVHVTAIPITSRSGEVVGAFALLRLPLEEEINRLHQEVDDPNSVLFRVMQELHKFIPFDVVTATRFSDDLRHCQTFFLYRPDAPRSRVEWSKQWQAIPAPLQPQVADPQTRLYADLVARMADADLEHMREGAAMRALLEEKVQSCIRRPIPRGRKLCASVTFYSKQPDRLKEEHRRRIEELPLAASVLQAIDHFDRRRDAERYKLLREVAHCPTIEAVYEAVTRRLCEIFLWNNTAIYRVDHARGRIRLVAACQPPHLPVLTGLEYEQDIDVGILGRVVRTGQRQIVGDVHHDSDFLPDELRVVASELSWPICVEDAKVRWIIDVTDPRPNAFTEEELHWLGETAREVGGYMQRLSTLNFLSECLDCTSEPIVVVDQHHAIKRANPAAAELFGVATAKDVTGSLRALFAAEEDFQRATGLPDGYLGEFVVRHDGGLVQADVSRRPLPPDIGGAIYVFKDMRPIRRALQLELMEKTAYEIALETRTPLMVAVSALERTVRDGTPLPAASADRVLKYLYRMKHAYTKLAMFNASVREGRGFVGSIDLAAEVRTIHRSLPDEMRELVHVEAHDGPARVRGDGFEVAFVLETVLMFFIRSSPEEVPVLVSVEADPQDVMVAIEGYTPSDWPMAAEVERDERMHSELRLAYPLIMDILHRNHGRYSQERLAEERVRYSVRFPAWTEDEAWTRTS